jgi:hypothetical protein
MLGATVQKSSPQFVHPCNKICLYSVQLEALRYKQEGSGLTPDGVIEIFH